MTPDAGGPRPQSPPAPDSTPATGSDPGATTVLIREGQAGNRDALGELFRRYEEFARRVAARPFLSPADQENVASDALGSVMLRLDRFPDMRGRENLRALLRVVIQRKVANLLRERNRKAGNFGKGAADSDSPDAEPAGREADPAEAMLVEDAVEGVLTDFVASLKGKPGGDGYAEVFADMCRSRTVEETAKERNCSTRTVVRQRTLVTKLLSEFFAGNGFEITEDAIRGVLKLSAD